MICIRELRANEFHDTPQRQRVNKIVYEIT